MVHIGEAHSPLGRHAQVGGAIGSDANDLRSPDVAGSRERRLDLGEALGVETLAAEPRATTSQRAVPISVPKVPRSDREPSAKTMTVNPRARGGDGGVFRVV